MSKWLLQGYTLLWEKEQCILVQLSIMLDYKDLCAVTQAFSLDQESVDHLRLFTIVFSCFMAVTAMKLPSCGALDVKFYLGHN